MENICTIIVKDHRVSYLESSHSLSKNHPKLKEEQETEA